MSFLNDISVYNAAADKVISTASPSQATLWTGLKNTANDETLDNDVRLRALTALITSAELLRIAVASSYPTVTTPVSPIPSGTVIHNETDGLQGGSATERYHSTAAQQTAWSNKASISDITFANLSGAVSANTPLVNAFAAKQDLLSGNGLVRLAGSTLTYDNSTYLTSISGISAGGELQGTYANPTLLNSAVIGKVLTGLSPVAGTVASTDSILVGFNKVIGNIAALQTTAGSAITALTGDVTATGPGSVAATISNNAVTFAKFQQVAQGFVGRSSVGTGAATLLTPTVATALLNTFTATLKGLVPASTVADGTKVLYDDGTWAVPPSAGSGSVTNVSGAGITTLFNLSITNPTTTPALAFALVNQNANVVFAGPASGSAAAPTWRSLVAADIPSLAISKITSLQDELDTKLTASLTNGSVWMGNPSDAPVAVAFSQDILVSNTGVATIQPGVVSYAKIQNVTAGTLLGRYSATDGSVQQITPDGTTIVLNSTTGVLSATGGGGGTPGGSSGEMQWNNAAAFDGYARMITDGIDLWMQAGNFYLSDNAATPTKTVNFDVSAVTGAKTWAFPDASDTFVGRDATQTLTNKTLTSPVVTTGLTTGSTTFALLNTTATTINFGGAATTLAIGAATGTVTLNNATVALTATPSTSASFSTATILTRASGGNLEKIVASGGGTTNFLRADGTWAAPAGGGSLTIGTSTIAYGTIGRILFEGTSNLLQQSANLFWDNTNARLSIGFGASPSAYVSMPAGTASVPHFLLTPSTADFTGTTSGMLAFQTVTGVSNLVLRKGSVTTNILTHENNSDFATGSASGVLVADTSGTITKSADLTALGIFAASDTVTLAGTTTSATTLVSTSLVGSKTLPASFFGVGKTIEYKVSGLLTLDNSQTITFRVSLAGAPLNIDVVLDHSNSITSKYFEYTVRITCKAISGSNSTYIYSAVVHGQHDATGEGITYGTSADSGSIAINTAATIATDISAFFSASNGSNSFVVYNAVATYLN